MKHTMPAAEKAAGFLSLIICISTICDIDKIKISLYYYLSAPLIKR